MSDRSHLNGKQTIFTPVSPDNTGGGHRTRPVEPTPLMGRGDQPSETTDLMAGNRKKAKRNRKRWRYRKPMIVKKPWIVSCWGSWLGSPGGCLYTLLCPCCSIAEQRVQIMKMERKGLKDYKCFALMYPGPCFCGGDVCDEESKKPLKRECSGGCLLCWEVLLCTPCAVRGNRYLLEQRFGLSRDPWEQHLDQCPFPYFTLDCCTVPCIPCIMTQQTIQTQYEISTSVYLLPNTIANAGTGSGHLVRQLSMDHAPQPSYGFRTPKTSRSGTPPGPKFDETSSTSNEDGDDDDGSDSFQSAVSGIEDEVEEVQHMSIPSLTIGDNPMETREISVVSLTTPQANTGRMRRRHSILQRSFHHIAHVHTNCPFMINSSYVVVDGSTGGVPEIAFMSKTFLEMIGYEENEIVGKSYDALFSSKTNPMCVRQMQRLIQTREEGFVVLMLQRKDGTPFTNVMFLTPYAPDSSTDERGKYMLCCQCDSGDEATRLMLRALPPNPAHSKSRVMILYDGQTFVPNVGPGKVTSPHFDGMFYLKTLTDPPDQRVAAYFEGRRRRFELQIQGEFKTPVDGEIFLNLYLEEKLTLGFATRAILRLMIAGVRKRSKGSAITVGDEMPGGKPAMALPLGSSLDRFIVSDNASEVPAPNIAIDMFPEPVEVVTNYKTNTTYSFSFHSAFLDLEHWCIRGLPGISSVSLSNITGTQALHVALTAVPHGQTPETLQSTGIHLVDMILTHESLPSYVPSKAE